jgi:hypothetical protein
MKRWIQNGVFLACVLFSVAGAYNVMSDNAEVEKLAQELACRSDAPAPKGKPDAPCRAQKTSMERNPIAQTFEFATSRETARVRCTRAFFMVGDYACERR